MPKAFEAVEVKFLNVQGGRLHDDLELVVVLEAVGVFTVAAVGGASGRLDVGHLPGLRPEDAQEGGGVEGACAHFDVVGLLDHAALVRPEFLQRHNQFLKGHMVTPS